MALKYQLLNRSKQTVLATEVELADTSWRRMKGLLGQTSEDFSGGKGLWISPSQGIHTIGMRFPIDVVYLDKGHRVIHVSHSVPPFRIAAIRLRARSVIELPAGTLAQTQT